ncbi:Outer membrane protein Imp, required for envelope biogenesis [Sesbania bispinosa]|nr:Outer membrane protein Imp, required for envelope biogenesis [Sesbania bispinosa]
MSITAHPIKQHGTSSGWPSTAAPLTGSSWVVSPLVQSRKRGQTAPSLVTASRNG